MTVLVNFSLESCYNVNVNQPTKEQLTNDYQ